MTHPGIRLRIIDRGAVIVDANSDQLAIIARFGGLRSPFEPVPVETCLPRCLPGCSEHGWYLLHHEPRTGTRVDMRRVDLPDETAPSGCVAEDVRPGGAD